MTLPVRVRRRAELDLDDAYAWYESRAEGLGDASFAPWLHAWRKGQARVEVECSLQVPLRRRPVPVEHERHEPGHDVRLGECFVELESPKGGRLRLRHPLDVRDGEEAIRHEVPGEREPGLRWLADIRIETALIDPGKPWQNGSNESFNGRFRDECLGMQWFRNRVEALVSIEQWRREYNAVRPHSSLGQLTPLEFARKAESRTQGAAIF